MFEAFKTEEEKVAERGRQMSPDRVKSYRLASIVLVLNAVLLALLAVLTPGPGFPVVAVAVALLLAHALFQLKSNWADAVLVIAVAGPPFRPSCKSGRSRLRMRSSPAWERGESWARWCSC